MRLGLVGKKLALQVGRLSSVKQQALSLERRYERDLSAYDIRTTERLYRERAWGS